MVSKRVTASKHAVTDRGVDPECRKVRHDDHEFVFGVAGKDHLCHVAIVTSIHAQLRRTLGRPESPRGRQLKPEAHPKGDQLIGVWDGELDIEQGIERHGDTSRGSELKVAI